MPCKYLTKLESTRPWLKPGTTSAHALCTACKKQFEVDGSGISQVNSHAKSVSHKKAVPSKSQVLLKVSPFGEVSHLSSLPEDLSDKMQALKAEIIDNVLYKVQYNYSFSSASGDGECYRLMFPGHLAAENYKCSSTKSAYLFQYGIIDILKKNF